jgi:hypothetical protein
VIQSLKTNRRWYVDNYNELKLLNPEFPLLSRTLENCMPAVTTELEWTTPDLLKFMIQTGRFRDPNGTIAQDRVEAALTYINHDWDKMAIQRWKSPGFDPERPGLEEERPDWKDDPKIQADLETYFTMKKEVADAEACFQSGPNDEYMRAESALLMTQRVDLWCAGPKEVERAVVHLYKLARALNERELDKPEWILDFLPGTDDMEDT